MEKIESPEFLQHMLIASSGQHRPFKISKQKLWMSRALFHVGAVFKGNLSGYLAAWDCAYILWSRNVSSRHSYFNLQYKQQGMSYRIERRCGMHLS